MAWVCQVYNMVKIRLNVAPQPPAVTGKAHLSPDPSGAEQAAGVAPIPAEFAQLATFYDVADMEALVRIQEERIEDMRQKLPPLRGPESDPQNYRRG